MSHCSHEFFLSGNRGTVRSTNDDPFLLHKICEIPCRERKDLKRGAAATPGDICVGGQDGLKEKEKGE
jgi:hypothetical protein